MAAPVGAHSAKTEEHHTEGCSAGREQRMQSRIADFCLTYIGVRSGDSCSSQAIGCTSEFVGGELGGCDGCIFEFAINADVCNPGSVLAMNVFSDLREVHRADVAIQSECDQTAIGKRKLSDIGLSD